MENTKRNKLISLAMKYQGNYDAIRKAIARGEGDPTHCWCENCITILDDSYPLELFELNRTPFVLFYKGNLELLKEKNKVAVIGSRCPSDYSKTATKQYVRANQDRVIISGLAKGIDAIAHMNANKTIAVLGCGIDLVYPLGNKELFERIEKEGLIISEYPCKVEPDVSRISSRHRIIAALADEIAVMELKRNGSAYSIINAALELDDRKISVLPQSALDENSENNNFLASCTKAKILRCDIPKENRG